MEIIEELRQELDATGAALLEMTQQRVSEETGRRFGKNAKLEVQTAPGEWADLTKYVQTGGEHAPDWGPPFLDPMRPRVTKRARALVPGPNRAARNFARKVRMAELQERLEMTDGTGNLMVNIARLATLRSEHRRADASYQRPAAGPHHPNERLTTFGLKVVLDEKAPEGFRLTGGTARQRACYLRAVDRFLGEPDPIIAATR